MLLTALSALQIQNERLPGPSSIVRIADSVEQLAPIYDKLNAVSTLDLVFNDATDAFGLVRPPSEEDAVKILKFFASCKTEHFVAQCQQGIGRSQAVIAALLKIGNGNPQSILRNGTYNRKLYSLLLHSAGVVEPSLPLVSMTVRIKYDSTNLHLFLLSMQRQRYTNWEVVAVTDGPNPSAKNLVEQFSDQRIRFLETKDPKGRWGHYYRQVGLDACQGEFIGMSNDDNYYVPGYFEQMLFALEERDADLALCRILHSYRGWDVAPAGSDLGSWIARRRLVEITPWTGIDFESDAKHVAALKRNAHKVVEIPRPLFIHN